MMGSHTIRLAPGLEFDAAELATEVVASLGNRGGGKSNGAALMTEGLLEASIPSIVLDYVGIWFSLRLMPDGKTPSAHQIPVLGGAHGDIGLAPTAGAVVAEALAERQSSAVLDLSAFSKGDRCRFAADFAEAFFRSKKRHPGPVQLVLEEAQRFVPQRFFSGQERMLGAFEEIAEVGRNYGVGMHLISQRPQKISKDVLNLADTVLAYRTNGLLERKAIGEWVQEKGALGREEMRDELPGLDRGQAIVWCPVRKVYGHFAIRKKATYDAGATPMRARTSVQTRPLDLGALEAAMGKVVQEAKANDPRELKAEVARLRRELESKHPAETVREVRVSIPVVPPEWQKAVAETLKTIKAADVEAGKNAENFRSLLAEASSRLERCREISAELPKRAASVATHPDLPPHGQSPARSHEAAIGGDAKLSKCAKTILAVLVQHDFPIDVTQLGVRSLYSRTSGGFANALSELRVSQLMVGRGDRLQATEAGRRVMGEVGEPLTGRELLDRWMARLGKCEAALLAAVCSAKTISRYDLAEATHYSATSGGFANALSVLRVRGLIHGPNGGGLEIADAFLERA